MDLSQLGALLREERERRGLSLDAVSDKIKITRTCLAAIEEGNEDCLPHPVYAKGFIKNYARLLGLDNTEFLESLSQVYQPEEPPVQNVPLLQDIADADDACGCEPRSPGLSPGVKRLVLWGAAAIVLGVVAWYLYAAFFAGPGGQSQPPEATRAVPEAVAPAPKPVTAAPSPEPAPTPPPAASAPSAEPVAPAKPATSALEPSPAPKPAAGAPAVEPAAPEAKPGLDNKPKPEAGAAPVPTPEDRATQDIALSGQGTSAPAVIPPAAPTAKHFTVGERGEHVVTLTASARCWLQAGADGGTMHDSMLEAGDSFTGKFNDYLLMRLGNAGVVEIHFDGKLYPLRAGKGEVKTLKFLGRKPDEAGAPDNTAKPAAPDKPGAPDKPDVTPAKPAAVDGEPQAGGKELEVFGQDGSWVILTPDGGSSKEVYVKKGQRLTVPFGEKIEVKLGNPSNVIFRYGGKETPVTTERGENKTIRFP
jgi:cytoskeleton protein RodZ